MNVLVASPSPRSRLVAGAVLLLGGLAGLWAAFSLTVEKLRQLADPQVPTSCDLSLLVQCGKNLASWQGSLLGFPNPLIGMAGWPVVVAVGVAVLAGVVFPRWWWRAFTVGVSGAWLFTVWLQYVSIFELGTLCPWCMATWAAIIPVMVVAWAWSAASGAWLGGAGARAAGRVLLRWSPLVVVGMYLLVALVAQLRLDWVSYL
jgi:uncharacterized membrane protein